MPIVFAVSAYFLQRLELDRKRPPLTPPGWLWPTYACSSSCVLMAAASLFDDWAEAHAGLPSWLDAAGGELKEGLPAMFILFYAASLLSRLSFSKKPSTYYSN